MFKNKLLKNAFCYIVGGILIQGVNILTLPIFTRILSIENFGIVSIYNTWLSILVIFICFQAPSSIGNAKINYATEFEEYTSSIILLATTIFCFWLFIFIIFQEKIIIIIGLPKEIAYLLIIQSFFSVIINLMSIIYLYEEKPKEKLKLSFLNIFINVILSLLFIKYWRNEELYMAKIMGGVIPTVFIGLYYYIKILSKKRLKINIEHWKYCLTLTTPIIFHALSGVILSNLDRIMIEKYINLYETGLYSFIYNYGMIISMAWAALNNAWIPWYYKNLQNNNHSLIYKYSRYYLALFTSVCIVFLMLSPEIVKLIAPEKYWNTLKSLPLLLGGNFCIFLYNFSVNYEFYSKKTTYIAFASTAAAGINFLLNLYFIPKYGGVGAALTTLISYLAMFLFHEGLVRIKFKYNILKKREYLLEIFLVILFSIVYYIYMENIFIRLSSLGGYLIIRGVFLIIKNKVFLTKLSSF